MSLLKLKSKTEPLYTTKILLIMMMIVVSELMNLLKLAKRIAH